MGGSGTLGGTATIQGIHAPGSNAVGIQTLANSLAYTSTSRLQWQLTDNVTGGRGTNYDGVDVTGGTFSITDGATIDLSFGGGVDFLNPFWNSSQSWKVVDLGIDLANTGGINHFEVGSISGGANWNPLWSNQFSITRVADATGKNDVVLNWITGSASAYDTWIAGRSLSGESALPGADPDGDGLANSLEFVLGGEPNSANPGSNSQALLPVANRNAGGDLLFTFRRKILSINTSTLTFQWSADLTFSDALSLNIGASSSVSDGVAVTVNQGLPDSSTDTIIITVPFGKAAGTGRLFGRLGVTVSSTASAYDSWNSSKNLTGPDTQADADPDRDGLSNALSKGSVPTHNN